MRIKFPIPRFARRYLRSESGSMSLEAILVIPFMVWTYIGLYSVTDAYRTAHENVVSTYAIGDILSRQEDEISPEYLAGLNKMHKIMTRAKSDTDLRVTVVNYNFVRNRYEVQWSYATANKEIRTTDTISEISAKIPTLANGESVVLVETWMKFIPISSFLMGGFEFSDATVTRPRYAPTLAWTGDMQDSQQSSNDDDVDDYDHRGNCRWFCW